MIAAQTGQTISALTISENLGVDYPHLYYRVLPDLQTARLITITRTKPGTALQFAPGECSQGVMFEVANGSVCCGWKRSKPGLCDINKLAPFHRGWRAKN